MRLLFTALACLISVNAFGQNDLPYPILYVQGLTGTSATWQETYNALSPAIGEAVDIEFCLNSDLSLYTSNAYNDITSFIPNNLAIANQYVINFNCSSTGYCSSSESIGNLSNQSAIYKQAEAIGEAIDAICQATGKEKVILLGHSMGGIAIREYLQNSEHWYSQEHRVAKLVTSGSPHVGFDLGSKIFKTGGALEGIDADSEAVRDLKNRHTGFLNWVPGVFFWGGTEDQDYMYDDIFYWYNVDVNCNGVTGESITGLNQRSMPNNLEFSSLWDTNDLVVSSSSASYNPYSEASGGENLCNVLDAGWTGDFHCESWGWNVPGGFTLGHNELPDQWEETLWALDEPDDYDKSYVIEYDVIYSGFFTPQAADGPYDADFDDYLITVPNEGGVITVEANFNENALGSELWIYDLNAEQYISNITNVSDNEVLTTNVTSGDYIIEFA